MQSNGQGHVLLTEVFHGDEVVNQFVIYLLVIACGCGRGYKWLMPMVPEAHPTPAVPDSTPHSFIIQTVPYTPSNHSESPS